MHRLQFTALHESVRISLPGGVGEYVIARLEALALHEGARRVLLPCVMAIP